MTKSRKAPSGQTLPELSAKQKVFGTARELFYREGFRAVGVDAIVAASGVAKTSLYRWFPTKDDLIVAVLESLNDEFWQQWEAVAEKYGGDPAGELRAQLRWIARYITAPESRGCVFLNATAEFPDSGLPVRAVVLKNKQSLRRRLLNLCVAIQATHPALLADQLVLLIDGAFAGSQAFGKGGPAKALAQAAEQLIAANVPNTKRQSNAAGARG